MTTLRGRLAALLIGVSATLVIIALAIVPFLSSAWMSFGQAQAQATAWTGFTDAELRYVTDAIVRDLVIGPPNFDVALPGQTTPVLSEAERGHMRDVRGVFAGFYVVALVGAAVLVAAFAAARGRAARSTLWRRLSRAGIVIAVGTVVIGGVGVLVFDQAFILFHEIFFPGGNWSFNPSTDKLVQIFPDQFWSLTTIGVGVVIIALALGLWRLGAWRASKLERTTAPLAAEEPIAA
ncbi:MAG: TIGR01906 family membrane protein [Chloroflexota bacterium]